MTTSELINKINSLTEKTRIYAEMGKRAITYWKKYNNWSDSAYQISRSEARLVLSNYGIEI